MLTFPSSIVLWFVAWGRRRRNHKYVVWFVSKFTDGIVIKNVDFVWYSLVLLCNDWIWNSWLRADFWKLTPGNNWEWQRVTLSLWWNVFRTWGGWERERPWELRWICIKNGIRSQQSDPIPSELSLLLCLNQKDEYHTIMSLKTPKPNTDSCVDTEAEFLWEPLGGIILNFPAEKKICADKIMWVGGMKVRRRLKRAWGNLRASLMESVPWIPLGLALHRMQPRMLGRLKKRKWKGKSLHLG